MARMRTKLLVLVAVVGLAVPTWAGSTVVAQEVPEHPNRVLIVLFDQMLPEYADEFDMPNYRSLRDAGTNFKRAYLGYMASETVMAHNVIMSGDPKHMGWTDEAYRDTENLFGRGANAMHITGDLSLADFGTLIQHEGYPKLADYLHDEFPGTKFIVVGEKSYAVESAVAPTGDIGVRMSGRSSSTLDACGTMLGGRYRQPSGKNVPSYLLEGPLTRPLRAGGTSSTRRTRSTTAPVTPSRRGSIPRTATGSSRDGCVRTRRAHRRGRVGRGRRDRDDAARAVVGHVRHARWDRQGGPHVGCAGGCRRLHGRLHDPDPAIRGANQTHVRCAAEIADVQLGRMLDVVADLDEADGGETLVVLTADHGATYGEDFYGKTGPVGISNSNWYYAPVGVFDAGSLGPFVPPTDTLYNLPSPALQPLIDTGNVQFSYQSTAVETWLSITRSRRRKRAPTHVELPGVIASYWRDGDRYRLRGTNPMTGSEKAWWFLHGQELVNSMAASNGPDLIGLLHDKTSYGVYGDHGGAQRSVQRVPMVFWSPSLAFENTTGGPFKTIDVMPTILDVMGIVETAPTDGTARPLS